MGRSAGYIRCLCPSQVSLWFRGDECGEIPVRPLGPGVSLQLGRKAKQAKEQLRPGLHGHNSTAIPNSMAPRPRPGGPSSCRTDGRDTGRAAAPYSGGERGAAAAR